jgi:hypothetical protein
LDMGLKCRFMRAFEKLNTKVNNQNVTPLGQEAISDRSQLGVRQSARPVRAKWNCRLRQLPDQEQTLTRHAIPTLPLGPAAHWGIAAVNAKLT